MSTLRINEKMYVMRMARVKERKGESENDNWHQDTRKEKQQLIAYNYSKRRVWMNSSKSVHTPITCFRSDRRVQTTRFTSKMFESRLVKFDWI